MRTIWLCLGGALSLALAAPPAGAWMHSGYYGTASGGDGSWSAEGRRGSSASGGDGSWSGTGWRGGSASGGGGSWSGTGWRGGTASGGDGSWHANGAAGGTASGGDGSWHANSAAGGTASGGEGTWHATAADGAQAAGGYAHPTDVYAPAPYPHTYGGTYYAGYHPPTTVDYYGNSCNNCGGWSGGAVAAAGALGLATGAAVGASEASANAAAGETGAYAAGVAAGEAAAPPRIYTSLPGNCTYQAAGAGNYFNCGGMWLSPAYGANGLYYKVVPAP